MGEALQAGREVRLREALCLLIRPFEQPVVGLEPDRSDPRMRLKQNWSFQAKTCGVERFRNQPTHRDARFGDESNQVS